MYSSTRDTVVHVGSMAQGGTHVTMRHTIGPTHGIPALHWP